MSAWGPNGLPPGVSIGNAIGGGFVQPERLPMYKAFHEVDTAQPRIPDRLYNPVTPSYELAALRVQMEAIVPKPEPMYKPLKPEFRMDPDPQFTLSGVIRSKPTHSWEQKDPELAMPFIDFSSKYR